MGSILRFLFTIALIIVAYVVLSAVISFLIKVALFLVILAAAVYLYSKAAKKRFWRKN